MAYEVYPVDPVGGWLIDSGGNRVNIVDLLGGAGAIAGWEKDPRNFPAYPLAIVDADGQVHNLADLLKNAGSSVVDELPEASEENLHRIVQYGGESTGGLVHGYFYECVESDDTYIWEPLDFGGTPIAAWSGEILVIT